MPELTWDGKYQDSKRAGPVRIELPFQTVETVNESAQDHQHSLELLSTGREAEWRNRLIWGEKKYVLPSLLAEFAGQVNLIYIDPPFDTGADFSFTSSVPGYPDSTEDENATFTKEPSILEHKAYRDTWASVEKTANVASRTGIDISNGSTKRSCYYMTCWLRLEVSTYTLGRTSIILCVA